MCILCFLLNKWIVCLYYGLLMYIFWLLIIFWIIYKLLALFTEFNNFWPCGIPWSLVKTCILRDHYCIFYFNIFMLASQTKRFPSSFKLAVTPLSLCNVSTNLIKLSAMQDMQRKGQKPYKKIAQKSML